MTAVAILMAFVAFTYCIVWAQAARGAREWPGRQTELSVVLQTTLLVTCWLLYSNHLLAPNDASSAQGPLVAWACINGANLTLYVMAKFWPCAQSR